ncbi:MAG: hypothetical protein K6A23_11385, partial [Butyrivibrio sp.]|nr:hypothetical protein [Butyrivibrio sp.]
IKSEFRSMLRVSENGIGKFIKDKGLEYWHDFQHGMALLTQAAIIGYKFRLEKIYIASSFCEKLKGKYLCASDPTIDNYVRLSLTKVVHDSYDMDRLSKVGFLVNKCREGLSYPQIHVCWVTKGGSNCGRCEKCCRTIMEIVASNGDPEKFGFKWQDKDKKEVKWLILHDFIFTESRIETAYEPIARLMQSESFDKKQEYQWFINIDWEKVNDDFLKKSKTSFRKIKKSIKKVIR